MLAGRTANPFHRPGWVYEEKVDGWRMLAFKDGQRVRLVSRNGVDDTERLQNIAAAIYRLPSERLILDGEVCSFDENLVSQFQYLPDPPPAVTATPPVLTVSTMIETFARNRWRSGVRRSSRRLTAPS
jgi:hypothetical protein